VDGERDGAWDGRDVVGETVGNDTVGAFEGAFVAQPSVNLSNTHLRSPTVAFTT
jgi:hypothetical protein